MTMKKTKKNKIFTNSFMKSLRRVLLVFANIIVSFISASIVSYQLMNIAMRIDNSPGYGSLGTGLLVTIITFPIIYVSATYLFSKKVIKEDVLVNTILAIILPIVFVVTNIWILSL